MSLVIPSQTTLLGTPVQSRNASKSPLEQIGVVSNVLDETCTFTPNGRRWMWVGGRWPLLDYTGVTNSLYTARIVGLFLAQGECIPTPMTVWCVSAGERSCSHELVGTAFGSNISTMCVFVGV